MQTAYEAIYIVDPTLAEEQVRAISEKYTGVITRNGGVVDDVDIWDLRRLAFEVKGRREGRYLVLNFHSEPAAKNELDRIFRISDDVLRFLIVRQDPKADSQPSRTRAAEVERREREAAARATAAPTIAPQPVTDLGEPEPAEAPAESPADTEAENTVPEAGGGEE